MNFLKMYCKEKLFDKESQKFMYFLDGLWLSIYGLQKHGPSNLHTFVYTKNLLIRVIKLSKYVTYCYCIQYIVFECQNFFHE